MKSPSALSAMETGGLCVFCRAPATTRDHVPPKGLFLRPRPSNLVTVPSCANCNNGASEFDEKFRNFVVMRAGAVPPAQAVWESTALRGIKRNRKEFYRLIRSMRKVDKYSPAGLYLGTAVQCRFEADPHDKTIRRLTRGLYWHHYRESLPIDIQIEVVVIAAHRPGWHLGIEIEEVLRLMQYSNIGGKQIFEYAYGRAADQPTGSMWLYKFYDSHVVMATTGTAAYPSGVSSLCQAAPLG